MKAKKEQKEKNEELSDRRPGIKKGKKERREEEKSMKETKRTKEITWKQTREKKKEWQKRKKNQKEIKKTSTENCQLGIIGTIFLWPQMFFIYFFLWILHDGG